MNFTRRLFNTKSASLGFNKINKFSFKKRVGLNHFDIQKLKKMDFDHQTMTETNDWFDEGSDLQSHFYHEFLFSVISKTI